MCSVLLKERELSNTSNVVTTFETNTSSKRHRLLFSP